MTSKLPIDPKVDGGGPYERKREAHETNERGVVEAKEVKKRLMVRLSSGSGWLANSWKPFPSLNIPKIFNYTRFFYKNEVYKNM